MASDRPTRRSGTGAWWHCVVRADGHEPKRLIAVESERYPDGTRVELDKVMARAQVAEDGICEATFDDSDRVFQLRVLPSFVPKAPPLWFVEIRESMAHPPAVSLLAFTGTDQPPGHLVDAVEAAELPVTSDDQLAAMRWYPGTGEVDQIYVQPTWRRLNLATALVAGAKTLTAARDWPRLWGDGQRTAAGELLRNASSWKVRTQDLTHVAPPMTPGES